MATRKLYLENSTLLKATATVCGLGVTEDERAWVRLDGTIFHAQGGGQKADRGTIGDSRVLHVMHAGDDEVDHFVDSVASFKLGERVELCIDAEWRRVNCPPPYRRASDRRTC